MLRSLLWSCAVITLPHLLILLPALRRRRRLWRSITGAHRISGEKCFALVAENEPQTIYAERRSDRNTGQHQNAGNDGKDLGTLHLLEQSPAAHQMYSGDR